MGLPVLPPALSHLAQNMRPLIDHSGETVGRLMVTPATYDRVDCGAIVVQGVAVTGLNGLAGLIEGEVSRAARDFATPVVERKVFHRWLAEQADLLHAANLSHQRQADCSTVIRALGGDPANLKICETASGWFSRHELADYLAQIDAVSLFSSISVRGHRARPAEATVIEPGVLLVESGIPGIIRADHHDMALHDEWEGKIAGSDLEFHDRTLEGLVADTIAEAWGLDRKLVHEYVSATTDDGHFTKFQVPILVGREKGEEVWEAGLPIRRDFKREDLEELALAAEQFRASSGRDLSA